MSCYSVTDSQNRRRKTSKFAIIALKKNLERSAREAFAQPYRKGKQRRHTTNVSVRIGLASHQKQPFVERLSGFSSTRPIPSTVRTDEPLQMTLLVGSVTPSSACIVSALQTLTNDARLIGDNIHMLRMGLRDIKQPFYMARMMVSDEIKSRVKMTQASSTTGVVRMAGKFQTSRKHVCIPTMSSISIEYSASSDRRRSKAATLYRTYCQMR